MSWFLKVHSSCKLQGRSQQQGRRAWERSTQVSLLWPAAKTLILLKLDLEKNPMTGVLRGPIGQNQGEVFVKLCSTVGGIYEHIATKPTDTCTETVGAKVELPPEFLILATMTIRLIFPWLPDWTPTKYQLPFLLHIRHPVPSSLKCCNRYSDGNLHVPNLNLTIR